MIKVTLLALPEGDELSEELKKYGDLELRVASTEPTDADVTVFDGDDLTAVSARSIKVFDRDKADADALAGASDFICRPVSASELRARILRLIAPENRNSGKNEFKSGDLRIDFNSASVYFGDEPVHLTLLEYKLLALLAKNHGRTVTYKEILSTLWEYPIGSEMLSIRVFVTALRRKFEDAGATKELIVNRMGKGYELI